MATTPYLLGAVAYDPKVVTIWEGFKQFFARHGFAFDYLLYSNYERQVEAHLDEHLINLPPGDLRSRAVIQVMKEDEARHAEHAEQAGARRLPFPIPGAMALASRVMKTIAYRI